VGREKKLDESDWRERGRAWDVEGSRQRMCSEDPRDFQADIDALLDGHDEFPASEHLTFDVLRTACRGGGAHRRTSDHMAQCRFCARLGSRFVGVDREPGPPRPDESSIRQCCGEQSQIGPFETFGAAN
jgi:hypothetical protein